MIDKSIGCEKCQYTGYIPGAMGFSWSCDCINSPKDNTLIFNEDKRLLKANIAVFNNDTLCHHAFFDFNVCIDTDLKRIYADPTQSQIKSAKNYKQTLGLPTYVVYARTLILDDIKKSKDNILHTRILAEAVEENTVYSGVDFFQRIDITSQIRTLPLFELYNIPPIAIEKLKQNGHI